MPTRRRSVDANRDFVNSVEATVRLVTPAPVRARDGQPALLRSLILDEGQPVPLRGPGRISLQVRLRYRLVNDDDGWSVRIVAYQYAILDRMERESSPITGTRTASLPSPRHIATSALARRLPGPSLATHISRLARCR